MYPIIRRIPFVFASLLLMTPPLLPQETSAKPADEAIKTLIEHRLIMHRLQRNNNITVSVSNGDVTLNGKVLSLDELRLAERDAYNIGEYHRVHNNLTLEASNLSDAQIDKSVTQAIRTHIFYTIFDWVEVQCKNGVVTLTGMVDAPWKKQEYTQQAEKTIGVRKVENNINVLAVSAFDEQIRLSAARLIYDDPLFARYAAGVDPPIHIIVKSGTIMLKGVVASPLERQAAGEILLTGTNAYELANDLMVAQSH